MNSRKCDMDRTFFEEQEVDRDNGVDIYYDNIIDAFQDCKALYTADVAALRKAITAQRPDFMHKRTKESKRDDLYGKEDYAKQFALGLMGWDIEMFLVLANQLGFKKKYKPFIKFPSWFDFSKYPNLEQYNI